MPRGAKPMRYDPITVQSVWFMYHFCEMTQGEVAERIGRSQKVVYNVMRRHGIPRRVAAKRNQRGERNATWGGSGVTYAACHKRVEAKHGRPTECARCGANDPALSYDWANLTGDYPNPDDYERMCRSCHRIFDNARRGVANA